MELTEDILIKIAQIKQNLSNPKIMQWHCFKSTVDLPEDADTYFQHYHDRANNVFYVGFSELGEALEELRFAYNVYLDRRARIISMADILKIGLKKKEAIEEQEKQVLDTIG